MNTSIEISYSPCPNDTFIFYAIAHKKVPSPINYTPYLADVEVLNQRVLQRSPVLSKISFGVLPKVESHYSLLNCGGALGYRNGPLLIAAKAVDINNPNLRVGIPGFQTTANKLLTHFFPTLLNKKEMLFSEIEDKLLCGDIDVGLIIHETRFTYTSRGLHKIADLGELWYNSYKLPLPLGAIVLRNDLLHLKTQVEKDIRNSITYAYQHTNEALSYIKHHAQDMSDDVIGQHIELYVNRYSSEIGEEGLRAISILGSI